MFGEKPVGVYFLHNQFTDELYVGSGDLQSREKEHFSRLEKGTHVNKKLQAAFDRDSRFDFLPVISRDREDAFEVEQEFIDHLFGEPGFLNIARSTSECFLGQEHTEETKEKISGSLKKLWQQEGHREKVSNKIKQKYSSGELIHPMLGKNHSEETKNKISETLRSISHKPTEKAIELANSSESLNKRSESMKNHWETLSKEEKDERMSAALKAAHENPKTEEHRRKISESCTGRKLSEETKEKIRQSNIGRVTSNETKEKIRENHWRSNAVIIDEKEYRSMGEASRELNLTPATIRGRINSSSEKFKGYRQK